MSRDDAGAFIIGPATLAEGAPGGPLSGLTFAVKDVLDVAGHRTGAGSPDWLAAAAPAVRTAPAVLRLLAAGATLVGKTITDELTYSISGTSAHYGTPRNSAAPGHVPGGSSSGSAAAVAAGLVDFAVGTDTGGSIRVPASYCGLFGLRPTWGRVPDDGLVHLAPSYDTIGLLARDQRVLDLAARALLEDPGGARVPAAGVVIASDAWSVPGAAIDAALSTAFDELAEASGIPVTTLELTEPGGMAAWADAFRVIQGREAWATLGSWVGPRWDRLAADVAGRFRLASRVTADQVEAALPVRQAAAARLAEVVAGNRVLAMPCTDGPAPSLDEARGPMNERRDRTFRLNCVAGHAGAPVVVIPLLRFQGLPIGLALIGAPGNDEQVLALAGRLTQARE